MAEESKTAAPPRDLETNPVLTFIKEVVEPWLPSLELRTIKDATPDELEALGLTKEALVGILGEMTPDGIEQISSARYVGDFHPIVGQFSIYTRNEFIDDLGDLQISARVKDLGEGDEGIYLWARKTNLDGITIEVEYNPALHKEGKQE